MKGPHERLKYDLRRVFECPRCRRRARVPGTVTTEWCGCTLNEEGRPTGMKLVEDGVRRVDGCPLPPRNPAFVQRADPTPRPAGEVLNGTISPGPHESSESPETNPSR